MNLPLLPRSAGLALALAFAPLASAQVVLDAFTQPDGTFAGSYVQKYNSSAVWTIQGNTLWVQASNQYAALVWPSHTLSDIGDSFSIDIDINPSSFAHNGGLAVWKTATADGFSAANRAFEPRFDWTPNGGAYSFVSDNFNAAISGDATGWATLTVSLTGRTASDTLLTATLSGAGFTTLVNDFTVTGWLDPLYVGPSAFQGAGGNVRFDNFTFTSGSAIPEPSTYAALCGAAALGLAVWRRRRATRVTAY